MAPTNDRLDVCGGPDICPDCRMETMSVTRRDHATGEWIEIIRCFGCGRSTVRHTGRWGPTA